MSVSGEQEYSVYVSAGGYPSFPSFLGVMVGNEIERERIKKLWVEAKTKYWVEAMPGDSPEELRNQGEELFEKQVKGETLRVIIIPHPSGPVNLSILVDYNSAGPAGSVVGDLGEGQAVVWH